MHVSTITYGVVWLMIAKDPTTPNLVLESSCNEINVYFGSYSCANFHSPYKSLIGCKRFWFLWILLMWCFIYTELQLGCWRRSQPSCAAGWLTFWLTPDVMFWRPAIWKYYNRCSQTGHMTRRHMTWYLARWRSCYSGWLVHSPLLQHR